MRDAAVLLSGHEQRVEDSSAVVDGDVAEHGDLAGLGIDLDHRHVRAERVRGVGAVEVEFVAQRRGLEVAGQLGCVARGNGQFAPGHDSARYAGHVQAAFARRLDDFGAAHDAADGIRRRQQQCAKSNPRNVGSVGAVGPPEG